MPYRCNCGREFPEPEARTIHSASCDVMKTYAERDALKLQNHELSQHLGYLCILAERLRPRHSHREEALQLLDGTLRDAREVLRKNPLPAPVVRKIEHCKGPYCIGGDKCKCQCTPCLQIANF